MIAPSFGRRPRANCPSVLLRRLKRLILFLLTPSISERHRNSGNENQRSNHHDNSCRVRHLVCFPRVESAPGAVVRLQALKNDQGNRRKVLTRQKPCGTRKSPRPGVSSLRDALILGI